MAAPKTPAQMAEDLDFKDVAPKSMHIEQTDKETVHLLVFLFMQFLASPQQAEAPENKDSAAYSGMKRSLHGLFSLLGYDEKEQRFTTMPHKIRLILGAPIAPLYLNLPLPPMALFKR